MLICCTDNTMDETGKGVPYQKMTCTNRAPCLAPRHISHHNIQHCTVVYPWRTTTHFRHLSFAYLLVAFHVPVPTSHFKAHPQSSQHNPSDRGDKRDCRGIPTPECTPNGTHAGMAVHTALWSDAPRRCPAHHCRVHHSHHPDIRRTPSHCRPP